MPVKYTVQQELYKKDEAVPLHCSDTLLKAEDPILNFEDPQGGKVTATFTLLFSTVKKVLFWNTKTLNIFTMKTS